PARSVQPALDESEVVGSRRSARPAYETKLAGSMHHSNLVLCLEGGLPFRLTEQYWQSALRNGRLRKDDTVLHQLKHQIEPRAFAARRKPEPAGPRRRRPIGIRLYLREAVTAAFRSRDRGRARVPVFRWRGLPRSRD